MLIYLRLSQRSKSRKRLSNACVRPQRALSPKCALMAA
jgi:hypothetical protein